MHIEKIEHGLVRLPLIHVYTSAFFILLVSSAGTLLDPSGLYDDDVSSPESLQK